MNDMTIALDYEHMLLAAIVRRALRDAHGDVSPTAGANSERIVEDARQFLEHLGVNWRDSRCAQQHGEVPPWPATHGCGRAGRLRGAR